MSGKQIGLAAGFEEVLGVLRGAAGDLPTEGEMQDVDGLSTSIAQQFYSQLVLGGEKIYRKIVETSENLQSIEQAMTQAIQDHRETDAAITDELRVLLADLDGIQQELVGSDEPFKSVGKTGNSSPDRELPNASR